MSNIGTEMVQPLRHMVIIFTVLITGLITASGASAKWPSYTVDSKVSDTVDPIVSDLPIRAGLCLVLSFFSLMPQHIVILLLIIPFFLLFLSFHHHPVDERVPALTIGTNGLIYAAGINDTNRIFSYDPASTPLIRKGLWWKY